MPIKYFNTAWSELKKSPGFVGKTLLLGLIAFIPIFGSMVVYGYLYGWARELAWRVDAPLPEHIFENSDGKLYRRGFFALVIVVVFALIPCIIYDLASNMSETSTSALLLSLLLMLVALVLSCIANLFEWVGIMRMSLYNKLSAGFQLSKIWKMMRHDFGGIMRILGMNLLIALIIGFAASIVFTVIWLVAIVPLVMGMGMGSTMFASVATVGMMMIAFLASLAVLYAVVCLAMVLLMLTANAMGHWTSQFDVALWHGQDDPMPFEEYSA